MKYLAIFLAAVFLTAGEYDFDLKEIEEVTKPYSYKGYFKGEYYYLDEIKKYSRYKGELNLDGDYKSGLWYFKGDWSGYYLNDEYDKRAYGVINELYVKYGRASGNLTLGRELIKWGKGYAYNAVAFFTRDKNPLYPEDLKEGRDVVHYKKIDSLGGMVKNYSIDLIYMPVNNTLNSDLQKSQNWGGKLYTLLGDVDIDFMFELSNEYADKAGFDFSFNLISELELHGEYAFDENSNDSYLIGAKYASEYDYTITAEWYKTWQQEKFIYLKLNQKDFLIDYLTGYITAMRNVTKNANSALFGLSYEFKNDFVLTTEWFASSKKRYLKLSLSYYF